MKDNDFQEIIKKYSQELIKMSKERALIDIPEEKEEKEPSEDKTQVTAELVPLKEDSVQESESQATDKDEGYALFSARVFTGGGALPVENAKVILVKDGKLYALLTTDKNGSTKKIRLPASPEADMPSSDGKEKGVTYYGEVYATNFTPKKRLLVNAVASSEIVLQVQLTPISAEVK